MKLGLSYIKRLLPKTPLSQAQNVEPSPDNIAEFVPIVSFPKSGNTYCRAIISRLLFGESYSVIPDIHQEAIETGPIFRLANRDVQFFKSHLNKSIDNIKGRRIRIGKVVWIRRHPLDVFLSFRNYLLLERDQVADTRLWSPSPFCKQYLRSRMDLSDQEDMANMFSCFLVFGTLMPNLRGAGNWFNHTKYWWDYSCSNDCLAIKYEDLIQDPVNVLSGFAKEFGFDNGDLERAVALAKQDTKIDGHFFWKQQSNNYIEMMPAPLIEKWYRMYGEEMNTYGYPLSRSIL